MSMAETNVADSQVADTAANEVPAFLHVADRFIALANEQTQEKDLATSSAGFLYANARFTAFLIASQCGSAEALEAEKSEAIEYFVNQYAQALTSNIAEYQQNYTKYFSK